ncbi:MAG: wax ester/triacylglycerol synthase domain-containing protein [Candidatus Binatia bacterium]
MSDQHPPAPVEYDDWMAESDALMWRIERDPILRSTVLSLWILDREPDPARLAATIEATERHVPRLRQHVVEDPLGVSPPRWENDPLYERSYHVRRSRVPGQGTMRNLLDLAAPVAMQAFDKDRPLWELHLVEGLEGGRFAVIFKIHHAMSDGVGMVRMTEGLVERSREAEPPLPARESLFDTNGGHHDGGLGDELVHLGEAVMHRASTAFDRSRRAAGALGRGVRNLAGHPVNAAGELLETIESIGRLVRPASEPMSPIWRQRSLAAHLDVLEFPLDDMKRAAAAAGATLNDVFVASVAGGLSRHHEKVGPVPNALRMSMPINLRGGEKGRHAGNQFVPARFGVPMLIDDPRERMRAVHELVRGQRREPALGLLDEITAAMNVLGDVAATRMTGGMMKAVDFVTSNVPGPRFPVFMSGARIERMFPFGPTAGAAVNVTLFSYDGVAQVGIRADRAAVGDTALLRRCLEEGFAEVLAVR